MSLISKYSDHLPLYRQAQIFARQGMTLDRSTLCNWVGRACWWLAPLHELMLSTVLASPKVFADDTTLPVLDPGRGRTKTGRLWCYAVDNRPLERARSSGRRLCLSAKIARASIRRTHLKGFRGLLQVDGYAGFGRLVGAHGGHRPSARVLLGPRAAQVLRHPCRFEARSRATRGSPLAEEALRRIAALYAIEADIRGSPPTIAARSASNAAVRWSRRCTPG